MAIETCLCGFEGGGTHYCPVDEALGSACSCGLECGHGWDEAQARIEELKAESNERNDRALRYEAALRFYAEAPNWSALDNDMGDRARLALKGNDLDN